MTVHAKVLPIGPFGPSLDYGFVLEYSGFDQTGYGEAHCWRFGAYWVRLDQDGWRMYHRDPCYCVAKGRCVTTLYNWLFDENADLRI